MEIQNLLCPVGQFRYFWRVSCILGKDRQIVVKKFRVQFSKKGKWQKPRSNIWLIYKIQGVLYFVQCIMCADILFLYRKITITPVFLFLTKKYIFYMRHPIYFTIFFSCFFQYYTKRNSTFFVIQLFHNTIEIAMHSFLHRCIK